MGMDGKFHEAEGVTANSTGEVVIPITSANRPLKAGLRDQGRASPAI